VLGASNPGFTQNHSRFLASVARDWSVPPAAGPIPHEAEGADRARSASESFLYRRLETLPETRGRFRLNVDLPIAFDGWGRMEVDLLCVDSRVVVEVDGAQHLADPVVYVAIDARTSYSRRAAISCCVISPRTSQRTLTLCLTGFSGR
jgi:hypothetical protein